MQGKPETADELIRCGMEAVHAHWLAPYVVATVKAAACLVDGKDFASVPPFIWTGAWDSCGARCVALLRLSLCRLECAILLACILRATLQKGQRPLLTC